MEQLRDFCWDMADGYQKRGQEVVANWLRIRSQFLEIALVGLKAIS
ncbi:MAG: hypothetical protein AB4206_10925 [Xenococcaceae cyanobacterium]